MKIKFFSAFLACAFLSVVTVSAVGCASDKNNSGNQAIVEYSKPVHVSRSVKSQRVYAASANEKTRAGVIKPYLKYLLLRCSLLNFELVNYQ